MDSKNVSSALRELTSRSADAVFDLVYPMLYDDVREEGLTFPERKLNDMIKNDRKYFKKFYEYHDKLFRLPRSVSANDHESAIEYLYAHCDLCELISRKCFELGVAYGKTLSAT